MNWQTLNSPRWSLWAGAAAIILVALLYLFTLDNGLRPDELTGGDLITHQYAQVEARPSNAPGYPLYTMGGWLWFHAGQPLFGWALNPIQILSAYSALWGLASLVMLYIILLNVVCRRWPIALLITLFYATTFFFWYYSVTTEQYTSAVFQTLLIIWLAFRWDASPRDSTLLWMAFISGTMLANMVTTLFILLPLLWFIFFKPRPNGWMLKTYLRRPALIFKAVGVTLLPLLAYAYIYIRGAQHPEWRGEGQWVNTWDWFFRFVTIQQGRDELAPGLSAQAIFTAEFPSLMWQELTLLVFFAGLIGLAFLGRRRAIFLYSTMVIYFVFSWGYRFGNWFQVIIPAYPIFIIGFAAALNRLIEWIGNKNGDSSRASRFTYGGIILLLVALLGFKFAANLPKANQHNRPDDTGLDAGWAILLDTPRRSAAIATDFEEEVALDYLAKIWGAAPGVSAIAVEEFGADLPVKNLYLTRRALAAAPNALWPNVHPQAAGEQLIALSSVPVTGLSTTVNGADLDFGGSLRLVGWEITNPEGAANIPADAYQRITPANWQVALYWQSDNVLDVDYTISVRPLVNGQSILKNGEPIIQDHQPVWGAYPTSRWQPAEIVRDVYALSLPEGTTPNAVQIVVYSTTSNGFENLADVIVSLESTR